jgi:hypothetical protein
MILFQQSRSQFSLGFSNKFFLSFLFPSCSFSLGRHLNRFFSSSLSFLCKFSFRSLHFLFLLQTFSFLVIHFFFPHNHKLYLFWSRLFSCNHKLDLVSIVMMCFGCHNAQYFSFLSPSSHSCFLSCKLFLRFMQVFSCASLYLLLILTRWLYYRCMM